ncbi:hypothetical protein LCGC14_1830200, partial [marine sediment metagenome]
PSTGTSGREASPLLGVFPTLLRGGGELDVASTPKGRANVFHQLQNNELTRSSSVALSLGVD